MAASDGPGAVRGVVELNRRGVVGGAFELPDAGEDALDDVVVDVVTERLLAFLRQHPTVECADQTALNAILEDRWS